MDRSAAALAALLVGAGVTHLLRPAPYDSIVPRVLPGPPRVWTLGSGLVELGVGAAVVAPATRRRGALVAAALFVAVFPANVQMALDARTPVMRAIAYGRLPVQVPLVLWALRLSGARRVAPARRARAPRRR